MAIVSKMVSDITGAEADADDFVRVTVRQHPSVDEPKLLDALPSELDGLKDAGDLVVVEINNGEKRTLVVKLADFRKLVPDEVVIKAPGNRGRRQGTRL